MVEFKQEWNRRALEDLAAFSNHKGGVVYVGVRDDGQVCGFAATDTELQVVSNQVAEALGIRPDMEWEEHDGKRVFALRVAESAVPVSCRGHYFTRVGSTNREMTAEQLSRLFVDMSGVSWDGVSWDGVSSGHRVDDVDEEAVARFVERARERLPAISASDSSERVLGNLGFLRDGELTNAGLLLFGKRPQLRYANARVRVGRFEGGDVVEDASLEGGLWAQLEAALEAVARFMRVSYTVRSTEISAEGIKRKETWEYPPDAVRELLVNALVHRDYAAMGDIQVRLEENGLGIWSPGGLPEGIEVEDLLRDEHRSVLRNPLLAQALYFTRDIERWGTGTTRVRRLCEQHGLPQPEFAERQGGFDASLLRFRSVEELVALGLEKRAARVVARAEREGEVRNQGIQELLTVSKRTATRILQELVAAGFLEKQGVGRGVRYLVGKRAR